MSKRLNNDGRLEFIKMLGEMRDNMQNMATSIDQFLRCLDSEPKPSKLEEEIQWQAKKGNKGPYQMATKQDNTSYDLLLKEIQGNGGRMGKNGHFYWLFSDGETIGRKKTS